MSSNNKIDYRCREQVRRKLFISSITTFLVSQKTNHSRMMQFSENFLLSNAAKIELSWESFGQVVLMS